MASLQLHLVVDKYISLFSDGCQQVAAYMYIHYTSMCIHNTYNNKFPTRIRTYRHLVQVPLCDHSSSLAMMTQAARQTVHTSPRK